MCAVADLRFDCRALLVEDTLVVADLHVGRGRHSNVEVPVGDGADMVKRFQELLTRFEPSEVVIAGDLLHSFQTVPRTVQETVDGLVKATREAGTRLVVTPGNHDTLLDAVWDGPVEAEYCIGDTVICHGHTAPETDADRYVVGHDHPTITVEGHRRPCFLAGEEVYRGADVVVLPTFNRLLRGVEVNRMTAKDFMTPLVTDADAFAPIVRDDSGGETLTFPPLGEFRHRL